MRSRISAFLLLLGVVFSLASSGRVAAAPAVATVILQVARPLKLELSHLRLQLLASRDFGLAGMNLRLGLPNRVGPYIEGRMASGAGPSRPDGALMVPGTPIGLNGVASGTWTHTRGVDLGLYVHQGRHETMWVALGWIRSTWLVSGVDAHDRFTARDSSSDGIMLKVGFNF